MQVMRLKLCVAVYQGNVTPDLYCLQQAGSVGDSQVIIIIIKKIVFHIHIYLNCKLSTNTSQYSQKYTSIPKTQKYAKSTLTLE